MRVSLNITKTKIYKVEISKQKYNNIMLVAPILSSLQYAVSICVCVSVIASKMVLLDEIRFQLLLTSPGDVSDHHHYYLDYV